VRPSEEYAKIKALMKASFDCLNGRIEAKKSSLIISVLDLEGVGQLCEMEQMK
jgi:hypothetical protein